MDKVKWDGCMSGDSRVRGDTLVTRDHIAVLERSSVYGRAGTGRSSWKVHETGRHEKALDRCPFSRLATLHCAPRTPCCGIA